MLRAFCVSLLCLIATTALAEKRRTLTGELAYLARIALPANSVTVIEVRDPMDQVVAQARVPTEGRQTPIPFEIDVPAETILRLRAGFAIGSAIRWASADLRIAPDDPAALGRIVAAPFRPMGFASAYRCGDRLFRIGFAGDRLVMDDAGERLLLDATPAASGAKYRAAGDRETSFWERGGVALATLDGTQLPECRVSFPIGADWITMRGTEPFWNAVIAAGEMVLDRMGMERLTLPMTESRMTDAGDIVVIAEDRARAIRAVTTRRNAICRDAMTGLPHPESVDLAMGDHVVSGCGGEPADLLAGRTWLIEDVRGDKIVDASRIEISFDREGRIFGVGGCNRFFGGYVLTGERLALTPSGVTMKACGEAVMAQERRFLEALGQLGRFDLDRSGALLLIGADKVLLRARARQER